MLAPWWFHPLRLGPWLRGEKDKRYYIRQFDNSRNIGGFSRQRVVWSAPNFGESRDAEAIAVAHRGHPAVVTFEGMSEFFEPLLPHQQLVRRRLEETLHPRIRRALGSCNGEFIGVHVRRGDFSFNGMATPDEWFLESIANVRKCMGRRLPALIVSDGLEKELLSFRQLEDVHIAPTGPAILDIMRLSRCRVLVASLGSSFSMWAAYLGGMPTIWPSGEPPKKLNAVRPDFQIQTDDHGSLPPAAVEILKGN